MSNRISFKACVLSLLALLSAACTRDDEIFKTGKENEEKVKIAVILPGGSSSIWARTLGWAKENILQANDIVEPEYEFYDENTIDVESVALELSRREDVVTIIGCYHSSNTNILARKCASTYKPVFTFSTSDELPRAFGQRGFLWCLAESDVTQCELLLIKAERYGANTVSLLAADDIYGQTFTDWFAFQAVELGMTVAGMESYQDDNLAEKFAQVTQSSSDCLICAPSSVEDACRIAECYRQSAYTGRLLFSDVAYDSKLIETLGSLSNGIEGIALSPDPTTGFSISYLVNFGENPTLGEAHVYDAAMISCYAYLYASIHGLDMNQAISDLLNQKSNETGMWTSTAMATIFKSIEQGDTPAFSGASGELDFSTANNYTSVLYSTYVHWMAYEGEFIHLDYDNRSESGQSSMYAGWEWNKQYLQDFDEDTDPGITYSEQEGNWAVVVAASQGWTNYRHQADALAFYQMLKRNGYDDEQILFVMADDIAYNANNPEQGVVRRTIGGENLYEDVQIDYRLSDLTPEQIMNLLLGDGELSLQSGPGDNVLFFWSGHGNVGEWLWGDDTISADMVATTFRKMSEESRFRKLLCFVETCYSGSVAMACEGIKGLLFFTATNDKETSKADVYNYELGVWMTNRFTSVMLEQTGANPSISLRELYLEMFHQTLGSHVSVYNSDNYGSIYLNTMEEFLLPLSL